MKYIKAYEAFGGASITKALIHDLESAKNKWNELMQTIVWNDPRRFYQLLNTNQYNIEDIDKNGNTLLLIAAKNGRLAMMKHLVKAGADISHKNNNGDDFYDLTVNRNIFINRLKEWIEKKFPEFVIAKKYNL